MDLFRLLIGMVLSSAIGLAGYRAEALSLSGVLGAILTGTVIFGFGGWSWGLLLIAFFVSSSLLSRYREAEKETLAEKFAKGHRRDLGQALANGGWGAILALAYAFGGGGRLLWAAFTGAMAAVTADTWATEVGVLSPQRPRLITTGQPVPVGTSGAVSRLGTLAALSGSLFIGLTMLLFQIAGSALGNRPGLWNDVFIVPAGVVGGLVGTVVDSLLGATVQAIYYCDRCQKETEQKVHRCGRRTHRLRGWRWLNNDVVNFLSAVAGSGAALLVGLLGWG